MTQSQFIQRLKQQPRLGVGPFQDFLDTAKNAADTIASATTTTANFATSYVDLINKVDQAGDSQLKFNAGLQAQ